MIAVPVDFKGFLDMVRFRMGATARAWVCCLAGMPDKRTLLILFIPYIILRASSYLVFNPRPYLWWHGVLDGIACLAYLFIAWAMKARRGKK